MLNNLMTEAKNSPRAGRVKRGRPFTLLTSIFYGFRKEIPYSTLSRDRISFGGTCTPYIYRISIRPNWEV